MKLTRLTRILVGAGSLSLLATFFLPLWQIQLWAPQYPEGLNMKIWHNHLSGAFDIINGLNHYIGMREIKEEMFPEFKFIGILIGLFAAFGLVTSLVGKRSLLTGFVATAFLLGIAALWDFYRWGYDYGHNLDPHAAIVVPGMAYQPPVIGYKNLLNFTAYSGPDAGGWVVVGVGLLATILLGLELFYFPKKSNPLASGTHAMLLGLLLIGVSCIPGDPEPIRYGQDACHACKMTLTDKRFGAELITSKGKVYKFDDINCLTGFMRAGFVPEKQVAKVFIVDFAHVGSFIEAPNAFFLNHEALRSPMRSDIAAFSTPEDQKKVQAELGIGKALTWTEVKNHSH
jgi:copper chaperone NosL